MGKARWTKRLLPSVGRWVDAEASKHLFFHLTQALTGHGVFGDYLARIGKKKDPYCWWCPSVVDDPEHALFVCPKFEFERRELMEILGREAGPQDVADIMCGEEALWVISNPTLTLNARQETSRRRQAFISIVTMILRAKQVEERTRQAEAAEDREIGRPRRRRGTRARKR